MSKEFKEMLSFTDGPVRFEKNDRGHLKIQNKPWPWSVKEFEFDTLRSLVSAYNCKRGFEIATGFGVSAVALGLGFKETNGKLVTMDAYVEELHNHPDSYRRSSPVVNTASNDFKTAKYLINKFDLNEVVFPELGWSPRDTGDVLKKHLAPGEKLDFVFIDGGHFSEQVIRDVEGILPYLAPKNLVVFHDGFDQVFDRLTMNRIELILRRPMRMLIDMNTGLGNNMMIVNNMVI